MTLCIDCWEAMVTCPATLRLIVPGGFENRGVSPPVTETILRRFVSNEIVTPTLATGVAPASTVNGTVNDAPLFTFVEPIWSVTTLAATRGENAPTANRQPAASRTGVRKTNRRAPAHRERRDERFNRAAVLKKEIGLLIYNYILMALGSTD